MSDPQETASEDDSTQEASDDAETLPTLLGRWRVSRFHLEASDVVNTIDLAPPYPFSS